MNTNAHPTDCTTCGDPTTTNTPYCCHYCQTLDQPHRPSHQEHPGN